MDNVSSRLDRARMVQWLAVVGVLAVAFLLRLGAADRTVIDGPVRADALDYYSYAYNLRHHGVYSHVAPREGRDVVPPPDALRSPGYPAFLWAIWDERLSFMLWRTRFVQGVLDVGTVLLVFLLGCRALPFGWALAAGLLTALSPHLISATTYLLTETLFTFLMVLGLWLTVLAAERAWLAPLAGAALGAAALTRPTLQYLILLVPPLLLWYAGWRRGWRTAAALVLGFAVVFAPWIVRNIAVIGQPSDSRLAVNTLHHGMYPDLSYRNDPRTRGAPYRFDPRGAEIGKDLASVLAEIRRRFSEEPARHLYWYLIGKPLTLLSWGIAAGMGDVFVYPVAASPYFTDPIYIWTHRLMFLLHWPLVVLALIGAFGFGFSRRARSAGTGGLLWPLLTLTVFYFLVLHMVGAPFPRYGIPLRPVLYLLAVWVLAMGWTRVRQSVARQVLHESGAGV